MPRQNGTIIENNFVKGLITETTGLRFPPDACTETWNCNFDETGRITRRLGIDIETNLTQVTASSATSDAYSSFLWSYIGTYTDGAFVVQQKGKDILFFDVSNTNNVASNLKSFTIDLESFISSAVVSPGNYTCQYTQGNGNLIITNKLTGPILVTYDLETDAITTSAIVLYYRDFKGLEDTLDIDERPTTDDLNSNPQHYYNLLNQGWYASDSLAQWNTARSDLPSNADVVSYFLNSNGTDIFDNATVAGTDPGNSPAPKGHFILQVGSDDREAASGIAGINDDGIALFTEISGSEGTNFTSGTVSSVANAFDGSATTVATTSGSGAHYFGKDYGSSIYIPGKVTLAMSSSTNDENITVTFYGSNSLPVTGTDGTSLGSTTEDVAVGIFSPTTTFSITSNDFNTTYRYFWVYITSNSGSASLKYHTVTFYQVNSTAASGIKTRAVAFFSSRVFYAGTTDPTIGSNIYFSQIIERNSQYGLCYQANDPTSIEIADLLASDGGVIKIPDIDTICRLYPFQSQLVVMAANGIWTISGPNDGPFSATGYVVRKISGVGMTSPESVVDVRGLPVWWGEDGIYTIKYDANYGSSVVEPISEDNIKSFFLDIPSERRKYVKGAYDRLNDIAYWIYSDDADLTDGNYAYNKVLVLNTKTKAFYPWEIGESTTTAQTVHDILYIQDGIRSTEPSIKFFTTNSTKYFYSIFRNESYQDWTDYAGITAVAADEVDYTSYFVSGYRVEGEGILYMQTPYIYWYLEPEVDSYLETRALFDWTTSGNQGKWSTGQIIECTPTTKPQRELGVFRRKYRGKGRAIQIKAESETGKPFTIVGWGIWASASSSV